MAKAIERIQKCKGKSNQGRLESFFGAPTIKHSDKSKSVIAAKRKGQGR